jgi:hypothetical protein
VTKTRGSAARARRSSIEIDAPRVKSTCAWVCRDQHGTCDLPGALAGLGGAREYGCDGGGGSVRRRSPACGVLA